MLRLTKPVHPGRLTIAKRDAREEQIADALSDLARSFEGPLADAIEEAFATLYRRADLAQLEEAIARGDLRQVFAVLGLDDQALYQGAREVLRDNVVAAARAESPRIGGAATLATIYGAGTGVGRLAAGAAIAGTVTRLHNKIEDAYLEHLKEFNAGRRSLALPKPGKPPIEPPKPPSGGGGGGFPPGGKPGFTPTAVVFQFDSLNPKVVEFLQKYQLDLIVEIDDKTREGIRYIVNQGLESGANPRDTARKVRQIVGLTERQAAAVGAYRKQLETFHERKSAERMKLGGKISRAAGGAQTFAVDPVTGKPKDGILERRLRDFRYDSTLQHAMDSGKPLTSKQIDEMVEAYARKYRRYRSEMIARTETLRATNAGILESWKQAVDQGLVSEDLLRKTWIIAKDERTCPSCRMVPPLNKGAEGKGIPVNQNFNVGGGVFVQMPPLHPACRCTIFIRFIPAALAA